MVKNRLLGGSLSALFALTTTIPFAFGIDRTYETFNQNELTVITELVDAIKIPPIVIEQVISEDDALFLTAPAKALSEKECKAQREVFSLFLMLNADWLRLDIADKNNNSTKVDWKMSKNDLLAHKEFCRTKPDADCPTQSAFEALEKVFDSIAPKVQKVVVTTDASGRKIESKVWVSADYITYSGFMTFIYEMTRTFNKQCPYPDLKPPYFKPMDGGLLTEFDAWRDK